MTRARLSGASLTPTRAAPKRSADIAEKRERVSAGARALAPGRPGCHHAAMTVERAEELEGLRRCGRLVRRVIDAMAAGVEPGMTTAELDGLGRRMADAAGALPAPEHFYGFPGFACISVGDEAVHGVPGPRVVAPGDVVKVDVSLVLDGWVTDACTTVVVPPAAEEALRLRRAAEEARDAGVRRVRSGARLAEVGRAVESAAARRGFSVMREFAGHGVGRHIHEEPSVLNHHVPGDRTRIAHGAVLTVEPILTAQATRAVAGPDGWTHATADAGLAAQFEHTVVATRRGPLVLTAA